MDRREINDVESECGDLGHPSDAVVKGAVLARDAALAARHHFVPGAPARARAVGDQRNHMASAEVRPRVAFFHRGRQHIVEKHRRIPA
jgi:hypothetical protein